MDDSARPEPERMIAPPLAYDEELVVVPVVAEIVRLPSTSTVAPVSMYASFVTLWSTCAVALPFATTPPTSLRTVEVVSDVALVVIVTFPALICDEEPR